jgi:hypothetical protein
MVGKDYLSEYVLPQIEVGKFIKYKETSSAYKDAIIGIETSKGNFLGVCKHFFYEKNSNSIFVCLIDKDDKEIRLPLSETNGYPIVYTNPQGSDAKKDTDIVFRNIKLCIDRLREREQIVLRGNNKGTYFETIKIYDSLNKEQIQNLENVFNELIKSYSIRTQNCVSSISLNIFVKEYLCYPQRLLNIKNLGKKSLLECRDLIQKLTVEIDKQYSLKKELDKKTQFIREEVVSEVVKELTEQEREMLLSFANLIIETEIFLEDKALYFSKLCTADYSFAIDFYIRNGYFPMFWILEQFFANDDTRDTQILINSFPIFQNKQEEIAAKFKITRERVRQIRVKTFRNTFEIIDETANFQNNKYKQLLQNKENDWDYILKYLQDEYINQGSSDIYECLKKEQCNLSAVFVLQVIAYLFRDTFSLFNGFEISNQKSSWKNTFLIKKEYADIFDFEKFVEEFTDYIADNEKEYWLDIEDFVINSQSWLKFDFDKSDIIVSIVRDILLNELYLCSDDIDGKIKIPATKERNPLDIVYEILLQNGNPMHIEEIFVEFRNILSHKYTEASQIRTLLQRHKAISFRNRKSVYTLKEWEHIKSGTIRDAIVEFLSENNLPQTAENITEYVLQHFSKTNIASVRTTMFNDTQKRFLFFENNLFGLANKNYSSEYEQIELARQRKTFEQRLYDLEKFIVENEHFPFSSSEEKEEVSLCRWWKRVIDEKNPVTENQQSEVVRVQQKYAEYDIDKNVYEWNLNYNKTKAFLLENRRPPFAKENEKFLYGWLRRAKEDFQSYSLNEEQRKKYIELSKMF